MRRKDSFFWFLHTYFSKGREWIAYRWTVLSVNRDKEDYEWMRNAQIFALFSETRTHDSCVQGSHAIHSATEMYSYSPISIFNRFCKLSAILLSSCLYPFWIFLSKICFTKSGLYDWKLDQQNKILNLDLFNGPPLSNSVLLLRYYMVEGVLKLLCLESNRNYCALEQVVRNKNAMQTNHFRHQEKIMGWGFLYLTIHKIHWFFLHLLFQMNIIMLNYLI